MSFLIFPFRQFSLCFCVSITVYFCFVPPQWIQFSWIGNSCLRQCSFISVIDIYCPWARILTRGKRLTLKKRLFSYDWEKTTRGRRRLNKQNTLVYSSLNKMLQTELSRLAPALFLKQLNALHQIRLTVHLSRKNQRRKKFVHAVGITYTNTRW